MTNILFLLHDENRDYIALIPIDKLKEYNLQCINGQEAENRKCPEAFRKEIKSIFIRLGITECDGEYRKDLTEYLNPTPPFMVDMIISISWIV